VVENLLHIVEREPAKDGQASIQPDVLREGKCPYCCGGEHEGRKSGNGNESDTSKEGSAEVQVFLLFSCRSNKGDRAHHSYCVESSTGDQCRWCHEEKRRKEGTLRDVESGPETILGEIAVPIMSICNYGEGGLGETYLSGLVALVAIMVPMDSPSPPIMTTQGLVAISL
jgi:hypothetical protein